ncbi:MAG: hypothetical protein KGN37_08190 [Burkholderiales bacterium]|nr:hypothetical protein [Burkholderiales bacterium]
MSFRRITLFAGLLAIHLAASAKTPEARFANQFSGSEVFSCSAGTSKVGIGVGGPFGTNLPRDTSKEVLQALIGVEVETYPSPKTNHIDRLWGPATFSDGDRKMSVKLNNNKTAYFERFGPTPEWPFKSKKDSQFFFTFRLDNGPVFKCKAVYQPDQ